MSKKRFTFDQVNKLLFIISTIMVLIGGIGTARAALMYFSETYEDRIELKNIGVSLLENGEIISYRDYSEKSDGTWIQATGELFGAVPEKGFKPGKEYEEKLTVKNSGTINQYVRVAVYKYWTDKDGKKAPELNPDLININYDNTDEQWMIDEKSSTPERVVLYYKNLLETGKETVPFVKSVSVDSSVTKMVKTETKETENGTIIKHIYKHEGARFCVEVIVDAIQDHNTEAAIWSSWGRHVDLHEDKSISLK